MKTLFASILAFLFCAGLTCYGQKKLEPAWRTKFTNPITWQRVHSLGYIIAETNDALQAIDPHTGKKIWENVSFGGLNPDQYEEVSGTQFLTINYGVDQFPLQAIVDVVTGNVLFDSKRESISVISKHILKESGKLLVVGVKKEGKLVASLLMYDIESGKQLWANDDLFVSSGGGGKGLLGKLQAFSETVGNIQSLTAEPYELDADRMIITHPNFVINLKSSTGEVIWKNSIEPSKKAQIIFSPYKKNIVFVGTEIESESGSGFTVSNSSSANSAEPKKFIYNLYYGFDIQSGDPIWKKPAKESDGLNQIIANEKGLIICPFSTQKPTINLVDYASGETVWGKKGKGIKTEGSVVSYIPTKYGILITTGFDNAFNNKGEEYYLNVLDPITGTLKYDKSIKLKGDLVRSEVVPKGLLFATTREVNILSIESGDLVWPKSIEAGGSGDRKFPVGGDDNNWYLYSPKEEGLFVIQKDKGEARKITPVKVEFEGGESPSSIDVFEDGIVVSSEQNIMKFNLDGSLKYAKYYPAPRLPGLMRALRAAEAVRAAYIGAAASMASAAFASAADQATDPGAKALGQGVSNAYGQLGNAGFAYSKNAMSQARARFKASVTTPSFVMMMTQDRDKKNNLIQVSKNTGEIVNRININNDKDPEYEVDQIFNYVYYKTGPSEIVCYQLK